MGGACNTYGSRGIYRVLVGKPEVMRLLPKDQGVDGRIILRWIIKK
jgi:hypothetical protein